MVETVVSETKALYWCPVCNITTPHYPLDMIERLTGVRRHRRNCLAKIKRHKEQQKKSPCIHRGEEVRRAECVTCTGRVRIKIFACSVYGECSLEKDVGVKVCQGCGEWES